MPVQPKVRSILTALALLAASLAGAGASAEPLKLQSDVDIAAFRDMLIAYRHASQVKWVVVGTSHAQAELAIAKLSLVLLDGDQELLTRIAAEAADASVTPALQSGPVAYVAREAVAPISNCSWRVSLQDPALPSLDAQPAEIGLAPNDSVPVSPQATFRLEHVGILQSTLYAFGETRPGNIRDLSAHDANIPVAKGGETETLLLATARRPTAFYETIKTSLAGANGERRDLGPAQTVTGGDKVALAGQPRGIGAGISSVSSSMIVPKGKKVDVGKGESSEADALLETCQYRLLQPKV